jgi:hypothetical protein
MYSAVALDLLTIALRCNSVFLHMMSWAEVTALYMG